MSIDGLGDTTVRCWMCGKPANSECSAKLAMRAPSSRRLDGLGYPVQRGREQDRVRVEIPRCTGCTNWFSGWIVVLATATVAAGIGGTFIQSFFFSEIAPPSWLKIYHHGIGNSGTGIGLVFGFIVALLAMAWMRKRSGRQSANSYPPVISLRQLGWSFLSG